MAARFNEFRTIPRIFWMLALTAIVVWSLVPGYVLGWDLSVYKAAIVSVRAGHDPYADATAVQRVFHAKVLAHPEILDGNVDIPYAYVYSPITLPLLRLIARIPFWLSGTLYWTLYFVCLFVSVWIGFWATEGNERRIFRFLTPVIVFFPGLLHQDAFFSGNIAYILYALVLLTAWVGWRRGNWNWLYPAVLLASCVKAPLLSLVAIPVLSARKQWIPAGITGAAGVALFVVQPRIWPDLFHSYLTAVELQFSFNRDFSSSPAGLMANALYNVVPYGVTSACGYLLYAIPIFFVMLYLSRKCLDGYFSLKQWIPVMMLGVILLNPRIMEYDVAPITMMMALIAWRFFAWRRSLAHTIVCMSVLFAVTNIASADPFGYKTWRPTECFLLLGLFVAGCWTLWAQLRENSPALEAIPEAMQQSNIASLTPESVSVMTQV